MKTRVLRFVESRFSLALVAVLYLVLGGVIWYIIGARPKSGIEALLTKLAPKVLWANFLLIAAGVVLCWRDISGAFRGLFAVAPPHLAPLSQTISRLGFLNRPGVWLLVIFMTGLILVSQVAPQTHRIYYDEDIYANMGQNIAFTNQAGMANYGTFEYGEYYVNWLLYNKDPSGWPFLISLIFQLFGTNEAFAFYLNNLLFAGGVLVVFFITRLLAGGWFPGLLAAMIQALIPHNLIWANTIAAENSAAFFGGLVVLCTLVWLRTRETRHLFLLATVLPLACSMRPESSLVALWVFAAAGINLFSTDFHHPTLSRHPFTTRVFWAMGLIAFALIIPLIGHFYAMSAESWGAPGAKFATSFFMKNLEVNGPYFLNNKEFPILFTLLALIGFAAWKGHSQRGGEKIDYRSILLMLLWFLMFSGIFLFFYAGSYKYGADVRFALVCFMPLAVLAGIGGSALHKWLEGLFLAGGEAVPPPPGPLSKAEEALTGRDGAKGGKMPFGREADDRDVVAMPAGAAAGGRKGFRTANRLPIAALLILLLLLSWLKFVPLIRTEGQEAWGARYDHQNAREFIKKIPTRSIILTHIPTMFLLWGQNAIQSYAGINNPDIVQGLMIRYNGHVYFHKSYWCNAVNDENRAICEGITQRYKLDPVATAREQTYEYGLYRMSPK